MERITFTILSEGSRFEAPLQETFDASRLTLWEIAEAAQEDGVAFVIDGDKSNG